MIDPESCFSDKLGPLAPRVESLVRDYGLLWKGAGSTPLPLGRILPMKDKRVVERDLSSLIDKVSKENRSLRNARSGPESDKLEETAAALRPVLKKILGLADLSLETVYDSRFVESTRRFLRSARDFDPELGIDSVYQALRNVWIMNTLQFELGVAVESTEAVFGYSMIYPYLDNFLDDPGISGEEKLGTLTKLKGWLEGVPRRAESPREERLQSLIGLIEGRFPRENFPGVYQSMLAIYNAQVRSLLQQQRDGRFTSADILGISLEKGGASVLADGYLVAGQLAQDQEEFCFGFGTFLQLADDLQDIGEDVRRGHVTLFSQKAGMEILDPQIFKFGRYMTAVLERTRKISHPGPDALREVIGKGCSLMAMESVGKHKNFFSRACVRGCQEAFPVRFSYLGRLRRRLEDGILAGRGKIGEIDPVLAAFLAMSSRAFALD